MDPSSSETSLRQIVFFINLPEPVAIPTGTTVTYSLGGAFPELRGLPIRLTHDGPALPDFAQESGFVSFRIWQRPSKRGYSIPLSVRETIRQVLPPRLHMRGNDEDSPEPGETYETVIEAVTLLRVADGEPDVSGAFDSCLKGLQELLRAYQLATLSPVPLMTRQRLPFFVLYAVRDLDETREWDDNLGVFMIHFKPDIQFGQPIMSDEAMNRFGVFMKYFNAEHPFVTHAERYITARYALEYEGDYASAVINANIAVEVLLNTLLIALLWEEGTVTPEQAAHEIFTESLSKRVKTQYHIRLGGDWNPQNSNPLGDWVRTLAALRNRVVHAGYIPTYEEAKTALVIVPSLHEFARNRVSAKLGTYPRTALLFVSREELERRNLWGRRIHEFVETNNEPNWVASCNAWRNRLLKSLGLG